MLSGNQHRLRVHEFKTTMMTYAGGSGGDQVGDSSAAHIPLALAVGGSTSEIGTVRHFFTFRVDIFQRPYIPLAL